MEIKFSIQQVAKLTAIDADELEALLKGEDGEPLENAPRIIAEKVGERITKAKTVEYDKAKSKFSKTVEDIVRKAGIEDFESVDDAVRKLADKANEKGQGEKSIDLETLTIQQLRKIPAFKEFESIKLSELEAEKQKAESALKSIRDQQLEAKQRASILAILKAKNAELTDPEKQVEKVLKLIKSDHKIDVDSDENLVSLDDDNNIRVDKKTQNVVTYEEIVLNAADGIIKLNAVDPNKKTPAPKPGFSQPAKQEQGIKFDSWEQANKAITREADVKTRLALQKAMNEQFPDGKPK